MIYSDGTIADSLQAGTLVIDPPPTLDQIQPASIDLTLSPEFLAVVPTDDLRRLVDPLDVRTYRYQKARLAQDTPFVLASHAAVLASTVERITLSPDIRGLLHGRSSWGRFFLLVHSAGYIDPGFSGTLTLELYNASNSDLLLWPGERICQLSLERLTEPAIRPYGHPDHTSRYQGQTTVTPSRLTSDRVRPREEPVR